MISNIQTQDEKKELRNEERNQSFQEKISKKISKINVKRTNETIKLKIIKENKKRRCVYVIFVLFE